MTSSKHINLIFYKIEKSINSQMYSKACHIVKYVLNGVCKGTIMLGKKDEEILFRYLVNYKKILY